MERSGNYYIITGNRWAIGVMEKHIITGYIWTIGVMDKKIETTTFLRGMYGL